MIKKLMIGLSLLVGLMAPLSLATVARAASSDISVQTTPGNSVTQTVVQRAKTSWPWYITRASGLLASGLLVVLILSGIGMLTGHTYKFLEPLTAWATHRALGLAFGVAVLVHMFSLLFDHFVSFNLLQILCPFLSKYRPLTIAHHNLGSVYVALGVVSFYFILGIIVSSLVWIDKKPHTWKLLHFLTYLVMIFIFIHALYLGTDLTHGIFKVLWIVAGSGVALAIIFRMGRAWTI